MDGLVSGGVCEVCSHPALVRVLVDYHRGEPIHRHFCLDCADRAQHKPKVIGSLIPQVLIWLGVVIGLVALSADYLGISGRSGFGWRQAVGVELGALTVVVGVLWRRGLVVVVGLVLLAIAAAADWLSLGHAAGMGWRQMVALCSAVLLMLAGRFWQSRQHRRSEAVRGAS